MPKAERGEILSYKLVRRLVKSDIQNSQIRMRFFIDTAMNCGRLLNFVGGSIIFFVYSYCRCFTDTLFYSKQNFLSNICTPLASSGER